MEESVEEDVLVNDRIRAQQRDKGDLHDTEELVEFRKQWKAELEGNENISETKTSQKLSQAEELYWMGVSAEQSGEMSSAILYYRQAIQLVPDIEKRISRTRSTALIEGSARHDTDEEEDGTATEVENITYGISILQVDLKEPVCFPTIKTQVAHICDLPREILQYIVYLAVLPDLDLRTLEQFGMVCKGFYHMARESLVWKKACQRLWGEECNPSDYLSNWRFLYISRPHVHFNGVYISRSSYIRSGEESLDKLYKPFHTVVYFRYLRFFSDGTVTYMTSPEEPSQVIGRIKNKIQADGVMFGHFTQSIDNIRIMVTHSYNNSSPTKLSGKARKIRSGSNEAHEQRFHMELELKNSKKKLSSQLKWINFSCHSVHRLQGHHQVTDFNIDHTYTPFLFSRVKSYSLIE